MPEVRRPGFGDLLRLSGLRLLQELLPLAQKWPHSSADKVMTEIREQVLLNAIHKIAALRPQQQTVPLDRVFGLLREAIETAENAIRDHSLMR